MKLDATQILQPSDAWAAQPWAVSISQVAPDYFEIDQLADAVACYLSSAARTDGKYPGALVKLPIQNMNGATGITITVPIWADEAALAKAQALELDLMRSEGGLVYQLCSTYQIAGGGKLLTAAANGAWQDIGMPAWLIPPEQWVNVLFAFSIDRATQTSTCTSVQLGVNPAFITTPPLVKVPALSNLGWPDITAAQIQLTGTPAGGAFSFKVGPWTIHSTC